MVNRPGETLGEAVVPYTVALIDAAVVLQDLTLFRLSLNTELLSCDPRFEELSDTASKLDLETKNGSLRAQPFAEDLVDLGKSDTAQTRNSDCGF